MWKLTWSDEFEGGLLDSSKWSLHKSQYSNNEQSYYSSENVIVSNGELTLKAEKKSNPDNKPYVSGAIESKGKFSQTYGRFEMRAKLPVGQGYWSAFWLMPETNEYGNWSSSGEIDIMETGGDLDRYVGTIHYTGLNNQHQLSSTGSVYLPNGGLNSDYHIYAVEWTPTEIRWYCDDVLMGKTNNWSTYGITGQEKQKFPAPFDKNFYIIINLAVGGNFIGNKLPLSNNEQGQMVIDYVRVYAQDTYDMPIIEQNDVLPSIELKPSGINIIKNGDFSDTINKMWELDGRNGIKEPIILNGELVVEITQDVYEQHLQSIKYINPINIEKDKKYRLTFKARSNKIIKHIRPVIDRPNAGWSKIFLYSALDFGLQTNEYIMDFTATVSDTQARLLFYSGLMGNDIGGGSHIIYFDDIRLEELVEVKPIEPSVISDKINVAKGKSVIVDSVHAGYIGENAVNGDNKSNIGRWVSASTSDQHFIEIDLGGLYTISEMRTYFGFDGYNQALININ
jgi:beta-glucanase (GH16 family)